MEEILIQRDVKTTIQILYDKGLFDNFPNADKVFKNFGFVTRRVACLEEVNAVIQCFSHKYHLKNKAKSNIKIQQLLSSIGLDNVCIYL